MNKEEQIKIESLPTQERIVYVIERALEIMREKHDMGIECHSYILSLAYDEGEILRSAYGSTSDILSNITEVLLSNSEVFTSDVIRKWAEYLIMRTKQH